MGSKKQLQPNRQRESPKMVVTENHKLFWDAVMQIRADPRLKKMKLMSI